MRTVRVVVILAAAVLGLTGALAGCKQSREKWIEKFEAAMPDALCESHQYFRQCFEIDEATCKRTAAEEVHKCMSTVTIPAELDRDDGGRLGQQIGSCAGSAFERALIAKRRNTAECNDPSHWTK